MCQEDPSMYIDLKGEKCIKIATVIINHLITNKIDNINILAMFVLTFILFQYQCIKIHKYAKRYYPQNVNIEFQILFYILTLVRMIQLSYAYLGHQFDQNPEGWTVDNHKLNYCDPLFVKDPQRKCFVSYEINAIFSDINLYLFIISIQMMIFWKKSISPSMFVNIFSVLLNQWITRTTKFFYLSFIILDIIIFYFSIVVWILQYSESSLELLQIFQLVFACLTIMYFFVSIYQQSKYYERFYQNKILITIFITGFIVSRIGYLVMRLSNFHQNEVKNNYERTTFYSIVYLIFTTLQIIARFIMVELF